MNEYIYIGPVTCFGRVLSDRWRGQTRAPSVAKARSNLMYKFKQQVGLAVTARIELPGTIEQVGGFEQISLEDINSERTMHGRD